VLDVRPTYTLVPDPQTLTRQEYQSLDGDVRAAVKGIVTSEATAVYEAAQREPDHNTQVMLASRRLYLSRLADWLYTLDGEIREAQREAWREANGYYDAPDEATDGFVADSVVW